MWRIGTFWFPTSKLICLEKDHENETFHIFLEEGRYVHITNEEQIEALDFFLNEVQAASVVDIMKMYENRDKIRQVVDEMKERMNSKQDAKSQD